VPFVSPDFAVDIPADAHTLEGFRRWARSPDFPSQGRFAYLRGRIWVDLSMEQAFSHNLPKSRINSVLNQLVEEKKLGYYFHDGMFLTNAEVELSTLPDGMLVSYAAVQTGRVRLLSGEEGGATEVCGTPDMVLEVISKTSEKKDTEKLRAQYWEAGISEYWLVDAREDKVHFDLLRRGSRGYAVTRKQSGWVRSAVFGGAFRLLRTIDLLGHPHWQLQFREQ
jgi:Uma2 family endonuclease